MLPVCYLVWIIFRLTMNKFICMVWNNVCLYTAEKHVKVHVQWKAWTLLMVSYSYAFLLLSEYTGLNAMLHYIAFLLLSEYTGLNAMLHYIAMFIILFNWGCHYTTGILIKRSIKSQRLKDVTRKTMLWCLLHI